MISLLAQENQIEAQRCQGKMRQMEVSQESHHSDAIAMMYIAMEAARKILH